MKVPTPSAFAASLRASPPAPPEQAVVLCCDEKCQIQALQRSQPGLPLGKEHIRTQTHDYYRNGTVTLFAALDHLEGKVIAHTAQKHTHHKWLEFLRQIDREIPLSQRIHIILDNYSTHKHPVVKRWLARHPRFEPSNCILRLRAHLG